MGIFWRNYISAKTATPQAQQWIEDQLPPGQAGGRRQRDCQTSFMELGEAFALGHYVGTLDLAKAFDYISPARAACTLRWHGFPAWLASAVAKIWSNQKRWLVWQQNADTAPFQVSSSIPQGDSLSPRVLNLILVSPMRRIQSVIRSCNQVVFLDDRSWSAPDPWSLRRVRDLWVEHSGFFGSSREHQQKPGRQ